MRPVFSLLALATTITAFIAVIAGGYMSASHAGLACTGFPNCNGWSAAVTTAGQLHMGHRLPAYVTIVLITVLGVLVTAAKDQPADFRRLVWLAWGLAYLQGALGVATVVSGLMPLLRSVHQANGVLLVATLALITYRSSLGRAHEREAHVTGAERG